MFKGNKCFLISILGNLNILLMHKMQRDTMNKSESWGWEVEIDWKQSNFVFYVCQEKVNRWLLISETHSWIRQSQVPLLARLQMCTVTSTAQSLTSHSLPSVLPEQRLDCLVPARSWGSSPEAGDARSCSARTLSEPRCSVMKTGSSYWGVGGDKGPHSVQHLDGKDLEISYKIEQLQKLRL